VDPWWAFLNEIMNELEIESSYERFNFRRSIFIIRTRTYSKRAIINIVL
jgi:hypothetical protein